MGKEATNTDNDDGEIDLSSIPTAGDARMAAMDNIGQTRVQQLADENEHVDVADFNSASPVTEPEPKVEDEPAPKVEDEITPDDQIAKALVEDEENTFVTMKVNGVEQEVSVADMKRDAQKVKSATQKFEDAAQMRRDAETVLDEAKNITAAAAPAESNAASEVPAGETDELPAVDADAVKKTVDAIYSGNEDDTISAITELLQQNGRSNPATTHEEQPVDTTAVAEKVMEEINRKDALKEFKSEYEDVWGNPMLAGQADTLLATKMDEGMDFSEALMESGKEAREMAVQTAKDMGFTETPAEKEPKDTTTNKAERKKEIDNIPSSGEVASTTVAEDEPQGVSTTIAEMAAQRGANRNY